MGIPIYNSALKTALSAVGQTLAGLLKTMIEDGGTNASDGYSIFYDGGSSKFVAAAPADMANMTISEKTSSYSVQSNDAGKLLVGNHATVAISFSLPDPSTVTGKRFYFSQDGAAAVTLVRNGSEKLLGSTADFGMIRYESRSIVSDGTNWIGV